MTEDVLSCEAPNPFGAQNTSHPRCVRRQATCSLPSRANPPIRCLRSWRPPSAGDLGLLRLPCRDDARPATGGPSCGEGRKLSDCLCLPRSARVVRAPSQERRAALVCMDYRFRGDGRHPTFHTVTRAYPPCRKCTPPGTRTPNLRIKVRSSNQIELARH